MLERLVTTGQRYISVIKAADGFATRFLNGPTLGRWLLKHSDAVLHDSTGMLPSVFSREAEGGKGCITASTGEDIK